jgi:putative copper export protein/mono/diheme cytochrome c family protein/peroxiredoxin
MTTLLLVAEWVHLAQCVLLTGAFFLLLLAGPPTTHVARRWERWVLGATRGIVLVALASGAVVLAAQTTLFEGRPEAAFEPGAIGRAMLDTRPGVLWIARNGLLIVLGALVVLGGDAETRSDWIAARGEALALSALALVLVGTSSHAAVGSEGSWPGVVEMAHLLAAGVWAGSLPPLALLLFLAGHGGTTPDPFAVGTVRRFSRVALVAVLVFAGSGVASAWLLVGGVTGLLGTAYGHWLLAKLALLMPALLLAAASRVALPDLSSPIGPWASITARRMSMFIAAEAGLVLMLIGCAAAMSTTTPALHDDVVWPLPFRLSLQAWSNVPVRQLLAPPLNGSMLVLSGVALLAVVSLARPRPILLVGTVAALLAGGVLINLRPLMARAYPTSFARPPVPYSVGSIAQGTAVYEQHCASCHGGQTVEPATAGASPTELLASGAASQPAGDLFWAITHGRPDRGMPEFGTLLQDAPRWHAIHYLRALGMAGLCAAVTARTRTEVGPDHAWLVAPDFPISVGPLTPKALSDFRGRKMVLLVLYDLPGSRARLTELAKRYGALSVLGVEVVAVAPKGSAEALADLGQPPPVLFPVVTEGNEEITTAYRLFAPGGAHAEFLIDRGGYIRTIWRSNKTGMPDADAVQAQVERLNEEKSPPPLADDHIH